MTGGSSSTAEKTEGGSIPPPLDERLPRLRNALADAERLLICLDFDGTLAPIVETPDEAVPTDEMQAAVTALADAPAVTTAIVSGRALRDVRGRIDGPAIYAGNHGLELARDGSIAVHPIGRKRARRIETVCTTLETVLAPIPNYRIENKRLTGTVHFRSVPEAAHAVVAAHTRRVVDWIASDDLEISTGKCILEIEPSIPWGKGNAVELIAAELPSETLSIYVGDDVTDESAFRAVEPDGFGIRVGGPEPSASSCRVRSPGEVTAFLTWLESVGVELVRTGMAGASGAPNRSPSIDRAGENGWWE
ncbi:trehalose-phosphatase [Natronobacterium gregoryi]|uniref:Trehalose 6-phosphate phosphatase n=2 Tax=Natronobacterium gregoryi TaxID=44930 RepID=L0AN13_NATGS|nr:trehalose-phosphatase [Natronobacterium gregoryi]AFZ74470.1 trehalose-phosphatase [Natronobacterium gregoryi SP2]ELY72460.1 trehalose-phosphatase [Natronobacterium gregoryi SP2]PLK21783.1 trehalose-phosphatase [Natronobacterium gregoryi SP2]SFJ45904.1 trehalose 6-phosphate phosphatase [Natronobacterium gregoryi]